MNHSNNIEITEDDIPRLAEIALKQAFDEALASGKSVLEARDGFLVEIFPDGTIQEIRQIAPPISMTSGQTISLQ